MTKKRKAELDLDVERNLHSSFVTAANSISHLFTQAIQQNKKAQVAGAQQALERQVGWLLKEYGNAQYIPMNVLLAHLQQEIQHVDALDLQQSQASGFPAGGSAGYDGATTDSSMVDQPQHKHMRHTFPQQLISPMKRQANTQTGIYNYGHEVAMSPGYNQQGNAPPSFFGPSNGQ
ncbi:hypothetical protein WJX77_004313 [Trebouxia sp. C0004]